MTSSWPESMGDVDQMRDYLILQQQNIMSVRRDSLTSSHAYRLCCKHPEKMATHQLLTKNVSSDAFYCEKCSIMLASQGYNVMKLTALPNTMAKKDSISSHNSRSSSCRQSTIPSSRKAQICSFVQSLQSTQHDLSHKLTRIHEHLIKSETEHGRIIEETNKFYKQIQEIIELQKYTTYNSILNRRYMEENKIRDLRDGLLEASVEIQAILEDIRENMDAVETVDYSIYNAIMGGYMVKLEGINGVAKSTLNIKQVQTYEVILPEIPKVLLTLSNKIQILQKKPQSSIPNSMHNSFNASTYKPPRVITEDDEVVCISEQQSNSQEYPYAQYSSLQPEACRDTNRHLQIQRSEYEYEEQEQESIQIAKQRQIQSEMYKQNKTDNIKPTSKAGEDIVIKQIIRSRNQFPEMAFSFDEQSHNEKQLRLRERDDSNLMDCSNLLTIRGFEEGKLSKIEERMNNKEVCESRESLGEYLNIETSREGAHFLQDTQTLLIA